MACMFCTRCGGCELGKIHAPLAAGTCLMCGSELEEGVSLCPICGAPVCKPIVPASPSSTDTEHDIN